MYFVDILSKHHISCLIHSQNIQPLKNTMQYAELFLHSIAKLI